MTDSQNPSDSKNVYIVATARYVTLTPLYEALNTVYHSRDAPLQWSYVYNKDTFVTAEQSSKFMSMLDNDQQVRTMIAGDVDVAKRAPRDTYLSETKDHLKSSKIDYANFCNTFTKYKQRDGVHDILNDIDSSVDNIVLLTGDIDDVLFNNGTSGASMDQLMQLVIKLADKCDKMGHKVSIVFDDMKASSLVASTVNIQHGTKPRLHLAKHCYEQRLCYDSPFIAPGYLDDECNDEDESLRLLGSMAIVDGPNKGVVVNVMCGNVACAVHFPGLIATQDFDKQLYVYCDADKLMHALQTCIIANKGKLEKISHNTEQHLMQAPSDRENNAWNHIFHYIKKICHNPTDDSEDDKSEVAMPNPLCRLVLGDELFTLASVDPLKEEMHSKGVDMIQVGKHTSQFAMRRFTHACSMFWSHPKQCTALLMVMVFMYATSMLSYLPTGNPLNIPHATQSMVGEVQGTIVQLVPNSLNDCLSMLTSDYCILSVCVWAMMFDAWTYMRKGGVKAYMTSATLTISAGVFVASYVYDDMMLFMISVSFVSLLIMKDSRTYIEVAYKKVKTCFVAASDGSTELDKAKKALAEYTAQKATSSAKVSSLDPVKEEVTATPSDGLTSKVLNTLHKTAHAAVKSVGGGTGKVVDGTKKTASKVVDLLNTKDSTDDHNNAATALINCRKEHDVKDQFIELLKHDAKELRVNHAELTPIGADLKPSPKLLGTDSVNTPSTKTPSATSTTVVRIPRTRGKKSKFNVSTRNRTYMTN